jgi:Coenzyme A transferase
MSATKTEILIATIARLLAGCRSVVIGNQSPIPGSAALVARELSGGALRVTILGSRRHTDFTNGGVETFDRAAQGRVDAFFLGGGQIDGEANINLVGSGEYPRVDVRWPGSFGSAYLYFLVPRVILFREEHTPRVFVKKVDFVSAPGRACSRSTSRASASRWRACTRATPSRRSSRTRGSNSTGPPARRRHRTPIRACSPLSAVRSATKSRRRIRSSPPRSERPLRACASSVA